MPQSVCFLSCSFRDEDKEVVTFFKNLLEESFTVATAEPEDRTNLYDKIFPKIRASKSFFAIFSKRAKVIRSTWAPPPDVLIESAFALAHNLPLFGFVEEGINEQQQGLLRFSATNYPRFKRDDLEHRRIQLRAYIKAAAEQLGREITNPYDYTNVIKEVCVYRNGYGVSRTQCSVEFNKDGAEFAARHSFGPGRSARKRLVLPPFGKMLGEGPEARRESNYFLSACVNKGPVADDAITLQEVSRVAKKVVFDLKITGHFSTSSLLTYEWAWGSPDLFPVTLKNPETMGDRPLDLESTCGLPNVKRGANFTFCLRFGKTYRFR